MRNTRRAVAALLAATALAAGGSPAQAIPEVGGLQITLTFNVPDPQVTARVCTLTFTPASRVTFVSTGIGTGTAVQSGTARISSTGCPSVTWTVTATVVDQAPGHASRTVTRAAFGNPASATAGQSVGYSVGAREAGVVTFTLAASSRLGSFCWLDTWQVTAFGNPSPLTTNPC